MTRTSYRYRQRAFSLYELLVTLTVAAVVLVIGVPSFGSLMARQRQHAELNALFHAVHLARKVSITRRRVVTICPSADGASCGRDWSRGWIMFENVDRDAPPSVDAGEPVLSRHSAGKGVRVVANRRAFTLRATRLRATNGTIVVCDDAGRIAPRALVVSYTGRPRVASETPRGEPYTCAD